jgi:predicted F0F1-ATPase subunit
MTNIPQKLSPSRLSARAKQSSFSSFLGHISLSLLVAPLGGYLIGFCLDYLWPGKISWAITLLFLGFFMGFIYLWYWMKRPLE